MKAFSRLGRVNVVFGRRRIGKTRFIRELLKEKLKSRRAVYLLAINKGLDTNLRRFSDELSRAYSVPGLRFKSYRQMFEFLNTRKETEIVAIDEFGYLIARGILAEFQEIIDRITKKKLILTGSSISLMENSFLAQRSPLYGRTDRILHLLPLGFRDLFEWFRGFDFESILKIYASVGGVPRYLEFFNKKQPPEKQIISSMMMQGFLFYDARKLLEEELREPERYFTIMEAISSGKNKLSEIKNFTGIEFSSLPFYIQKLRRLKIIKRLKPLMGRHKGKYEIDDLYFRFWFRFVYPYEDEIDSMFCDNAINNFRKNFNSYLGYVFEHVCREFVRYFFSYTKIGRWWQKDRELDILAMNEDRAELLAAECKWQSRVNAEEIAAKLAEELGFIDCRAKHSYAIFAKSFSKRITGFQGSRVWCFDSADMEKILRRQKPQS